MIAPARKSMILDELGRPYTRPTAPVPELYELNETKPQRQVQATYDSVRPSDEFDNFWANGDSYDADSANSKAVREKLVRNSRYDVANSGFSDGIAQTSATDLVGTGPTLRMQTGSKAFNQLVETEWYRWSKAIQLRRKFWTMAHAKHQDGEAIAVARTNPKVKHQVKLDVRLYETEQCQTPYLPFNDPGYIDGIRFDEFGNPEYYDILKQHPGATGFYQPTLEPEQVEARYVLHWFKMRRPGQHRGVPECASTQNVGAASRRWREATIAAAEAVASFGAILLKTQLSPDITPMGAAPFSTMDIQKRMMTALPMGWDASQMESKHPNATYESFNKSLINEQARPKSMPYNKAACDSSSYNYASGRLDHQTYHGSLDVEREDANDLVLDPLFELWFEEAVKVFGWLGGDFAALSPAAMSHTWDWPKHAVADIVSEAEAQDKRLRNGMTYPAREYATEGRDYEDESPVAAENYGLGEPEYKQHHRNALFNDKNQQASMLQADTQAKSAEAAAKLAANPPAVPTQDTGATNGQE